ncbi:MAG: prenyltransferase/squalene oxidase repeat-containing protein [Planctomycetota bacterium]|nr:prenyltransferase/squalene oxidase repeat-containing protein [Planctomycetota bacterium]
MRLARRITSHALVLACVFTSLLILAAAPAADEGNDDLLRAPEKSLDPRIQPERITEQAPPPPPEQMVLPLPPDHRIAASPDQVPVSEAHWQRAVEAIGKGLAYLRAQQDESGGWMTEMMAAPTDEPDKPSPIAVAVTALAVKAIVQVEPEARSTPQLQRAIRFIYAAQNENGSFEGGALTNYVTSTVVSALASLDDPAFGKDIRSGAGWLQRNQWDQSEGLSPRQDWFGGAGYGNHGRPDLSNTQMMLEALYDAGLDPDEPAFQRALTFLTRTQNLRETNKADWAGRDGGFIYTAANGGESMASEYAGEGRHGEDLPPEAPRSLRSYGSMTYAGFKSLLYAGLSPDDVRVRAAFDWIRRHFTFQENPGLGDQGLYYYFHAMSRALRVAQQHTIADVDGEEHNWREELIDAIIARQNEDGSWKNTADRWLESRPVLATVYCILSLEEVLKPVEKAEGDEHAG